MRYNEQLNLKLYKYENGNFQAQAIIDDYQEISFSHNLYEAGDFTITINYNIPNALKFERGMFIQFGNDPYMFGEILTISDSIGEDGKGSQQRTITGKDARYIFKRRVIKNLNNEENWAMTDKGEICLRSLIQSQCGSGAEAKRQLPITNTIPASSSALGKEYSVAEAFSNLYDTLVTIATQSEIGWRIKFDGSLTLEVYEGNDLSNNVQFSTDFDSLSNGEFTDSSESYANTVYVAGKGTGADRDIYEGEQEIEGASPSGLDRYEAYDNQSSMTSESEYEAEALSMLTQYGQTINVSGQGLAKCPYIFKEQYDIGDTITLAFSGKSAKAQILSVTEHWTWGQYGIEFSFGKPQNDLARQLQLMLKQIQKASNKTTSTSSVKYYTIPTDTQMPKADVIYDTIGFQGTVGNGATFTLYYDSEKTGAKTYHVYFKQLGGTGKLTLTTGVSGKANLSLNAGTYVAIIYVDQEGNVTSQGATPTTTIASGNTQPVQSGAVAQAVETVTSNFSDLPKDAVLHYSFDEVPDYPDGTAVYFRNKNFTTSDGWAGGSNVITAPNGILTVASVVTAYIYKNVTSGSVIKSVVTSSVDTTIILYASIGGTTVNLLSKAVKANVPTEFIAIIPSGTLTSVGFNGIKINSKFEIISFYIGDGSYTTPVIDNANGQNNGTNDGGIAVQGVSGKGLYSTKPVYRDTYIGIIRNFFIPTSNDDFTLSVWVKIDSNYSQDGDYLGIITTGEYVGLLGIGRNGNAIIFVARDSSNERRITTSMKKGEWHLYTMVYKGSSHTFDAYEDGIKLGTSQANIADYQFGSNLNVWRLWYNRILGGNSRGTDPKTGAIDDLLIFNRSLSQEEVTALYLNKANTPKYYDINNLKLPSAPSTNGTYNLRCTVASGVLTYSWASV